VGVPLEDLVSATGTITDAGAVDVIYGSSLLLNGGRADEFLTEIYVLPPLP
jgi:hypothetical protein